MNLKKKITRSLSCNSHWPQIPLYPTVRCFGWMLKLELQYFGHWMQRTDSLEKTLRLGKIEGRRRGG